MLTLAALLIQAAPALSLDALTIPAARRLDGRSVVVSIVPAKPAYTWGGRTVLGGEDRPDGAERGVMLKGERLDVKEGEPLTVRGLLRVIDHPAAVVNGRMIPGWVEIRVTEEGRK